MLSKNVDALSNIGCCTFHLNKPDFLFKDGDLVMLVDDVDNTPKDEATDDLRINRHYF